MQGDFYTAGKYREKGLQAVRHGKGDRRAPDLRPVQRQGRRADRRQRADRAMSATTCACTWATAARTWCPASTSSARSSTRSGTRAARHYQENVQTTLIPSGGAAMMEFHLEVPGSYVLVDHSIFRAFNKGALAILKADGAENKAIYSGKEVDYVYLGDRAQPNLAAVATAAKSAARPANSPWRTRSPPARSCSTAPAPPATSPMAKAWPGYSRRWPSPTTSPPIPSALADVMLHGLQGPVTVNGKEYNSIMPPMSQLTDDEVAQLGHLRAQQLGQPGWPRDQGRSRRGAQG